MKDNSPELLERIRGIIRDDKREEAIAELHDLHPADIAELFQDLDLEESEYL